jgi:hypothetical protein
MLGSLHSGVPGCLTVALTNASVLAQRLLGLLPLAASGKTVSAYPKALSIYRGVMPRHDVQQAALIVLRSIMDSETVGLFQ